MRRILPIALLTLLFVTSCRDSSESSRPPVQYVQDILSAPLSREYLLVSGYDSRDVRGAVALVGSPERCERISSLLLSADDFDNVDGKTRPDGLPDFAGETFVSIADVEHYPYGELIASGDFESVRELTVRTALEALDSTYSVGPYDVNRLYVKPSAKVTVLASPEMEYYGAFDLDTLAKSIGRDIPVLSPIRALLRDVVRSRSGASSVAILSDIDSLSFGVYQALMDEESDACGAPRGTCSVFAADTTGGDPVISDILDAYAATGNDAPLSAIIIDDGYVDIGLMKVSVDFVREENSEANLKYRQMLTRDFSFVVADDFYTGLCYRELRERNIFTHNIAYPKSESYAVVKLEGENVEAVDGSECTVIRYVQN